MMRFSLIRINLIFILLVLFIFNLVSAESKTFTKEYTYQEGAQNFVFDGVANFKDSNKWLSGSGNAGFTGEQVPIRGII